MAKKKDLVYVPRKKVLRMIKETGIVPENVEVRSELKLIHPGGKLVLAGVFKDWVSITLRGEGPFELEASGIFSTLMIFGGLDLPSSHPDYRSRIRISGSCLALWMNGVLGQVSVPFGSNVSRIRCGGYFDDISICYAPEDLSFYGDFRKATTPDRDVAEVLSFAKSGICIGLSEIRKKALD